MNKEFVNQETVRSHLNFFCFSQFMTLGVLEIYAEYSCICMCIQIANVILFNCSTYND